MRSMGERIRRIQTYAACDCNVNRVWNRMLDNEKRYARYLVERYGYTVKMAIQTSFVHGFNAWPYDYRLGKVVREERTSDSFGFVFE